MKKRILTEGDVPVAVQVDYADWLRIEKAIPEIVGTGSKDIAEFCGSLTLREDPVEFQQRLRDEWN
jgi:hypothetical protein